MIFLVDKSTFSISAHKNYSEAAKQGLATLGVSYQPGSDPVQSFNQANTEQQIVLMNLSAALELIEKSDKEHCQEMAKRIRQAVDRFYAK
ncbi:hypothetical protein [Vibrio aerogenes]|uniref:hypothetical protein n=1 Tax=Vibrio aerogenes TaxID=92172 RepID=UPI0021C3AE27|nr:hypothetical protein [Vibrio aerogenes]